MSVSYFCYYLSIFRVRKSVDDWIVDARRFGQDDRKLVDEWSDFRCISPGSQNTNDRKGDPGRGPQSHVHDCNFGSFDLGRDGVLICVASQRSDVHLFGLFAQFVFVLENGLNDEVVTADYDQEWEDKTTHEGAHDVRFVAHIRRHSIERASEMID